MKPHHFGIYKNISVIDGQLIVVPELLITADDEQIFNLSKLKSIDRFGGDIDYLCDLIMTDQTIIEDLAELNCYLLLLASHDTIEDINSSFWDFDFDKFEFLGWTISDYVGEDYAFCDGFFPVQEIKGERPENFKIQIVDKKAINSWGLIGDKESLLDYMNKNNNLYIVYPNEQGLSNVFKIEWRAYGVFCDRYTLKKLEELKSKI